MSLPRFEILSKCPRELRMCGEQFDTDRWSSCRSNSLCCYQVLASCQYPLHFPVPSITYHNHLCFRHRGRAPSNAKTFQDSSSEANFSVIELSNWSYFLVTSSSLSGSSNFMDCSRQYEFRNTRCTHSKRVLDFRCLISNLRPTDSWFDCLLRFIMVWHERFHHVLCLPKWTKLVYNLSALHREVMYFNQTHIASCRNDRTAYHNRNNHFADLLLAWSVKWMLWLSSQEYDIPVRNHPWALKRYQE